MPKPVSEAARFGRAARFTGAFALVVGLICSLLLSGCVDQHPERSASEGVTYEPRIIATSSAVVEICDMLALDLAGVPTTSRDLPDRYADVERVGAAMSPDLEIVKSLHPDYVLSPNSLVSDLQPKYASIMVSSVFLNMRSVQGMYDSIAYLGEKFDREEQAQALVDAYTEFIEEYRAQNEGEEAPTVLILMGVPGSYVVATPNSYVGSLVDMAGGKNVYADSDEEFVNVNTEDMQACDPDIILRTSHALPSQVMAMFANEFATNDIWKHFRAVQEGKVYDLPPSQFGMSADFNYPEALEDLQSILYGDEAGSDGTVVGEAAAEAARATSSEDNADAVASDAEGIVSSIVSGASADSTDK